MNKNNSENSPVLNISEIINILPHRYPFLLVDRVVKLDIEQGIIVGQKNLTINESFFQGHFPNFAIMPGVLILEALAQTGGILIYKQGYHDNTALLLNINKAKFRRSVVPGDVLYLHVEKLHFSSKGGRVMAKAMVENNIVAQAEIGFVLKPI